MTFSPAKPSARLGEHIAQGIVSEAETIEIDQAVGVGHAENIHHGQYLERSEVIRSLNVTAIDHAARIYERGVSETVFRPGIDPVDLHWQVSALCFFNVSNRATFSKIFGRDMGAADALARLRGNAVDMVLRFVALPGVAEI